MEYIVQLSSRDLTEIPPIDVIFLKKWQVDGVYPLYKAVKVSSDEWRVHWIVNGEWTIKFCSFTNDSLLKLLRKNDYLVSEIPMYNSDEYNFD